MNKRGKAGVLMIQKEKIRFVCESLDQHLKFTDKKLPWK